MDTHNGTAQQGSNSLSTLDLLVRTAYKNACTNGYKERMDAMNDHQLSIDLRDCDADVGIYSFRSIELAVERARRNGWWMPDQS